MGLNTVGLVIAGNYGKSIKRLSKDLELGIEIIDELSYLETTYAKKGECRLYFFENATIIFYPIDGEFERAEYRSEIYNSFEFGFCETGWSFALYFYDLKKGDRILIYRENEKIIDSGEPLSFEEPNLEMYKIIFKAFEEVIGKDLYAIHNIELKGFRCKKIRYTGEPNKAKRKRILKAFKDSHGSLEDDIEGFYI